MIECKKCGFEFQDTDAENREHYCLGEGEEDAKWI